MITTTEVELLATILARAGVTQIEAQWCNGVLDKLRAIALEQQAKTALEQQKAAQDDTD